MSKKENIINFSFVFPAVLIFSFFYVIPFFYTFWLALHEASPTNIFDLTFVRAQNFKEAFSPHILAALVGLLGLGGLIYFLKAGLKKTTVPKKKRLLKIFSPIALMVSFGLLVYAVSIFLQIRRESIPFNPDFLWWNSVGRSFYITLWALTFQNCLALILALAVDRAVRAGQFYRAVFFMLPILGEVVVGLLLRTILRSHPGILNYLLENFQLGAWAKNWLGPDLALTTLAVSHSWRGFGYGFIILLAGLQTIPEQLYEAARIDGANAYQRFTKITIPMLIPVIFLVIILTILGTVQVIGLPMALTRGGPAGRTTVAVYHIYNELQNNYVGYASTLGLILGLILITLSFGLLSISKKLKN